MAEQERADRSGEEGDAEGEVGVERLGLRRRLGEEHGAEDQSGRRPKNVKIVEFDRRPDQARQHDLADAGALCSHIRRALNRRHVEPPLAHPLLKRGWSSRLLIHQGARKRMRTHPAASCISSILRRPGRDLRCRFPLDRGTRAQALWRRTLLRGPSDPQCPPRRYGQGGRTSTSASSISLFRHRGQTHRPLLQGDNSPRRRLDLTPVVGALVDPRSSVGSASTPKCQLAFALARSGGAIRVTSCSPGGASGGAMPVTPNSRLRKTFGGALRQARRLCQSNGRSSTHGAARPDRSGH